MTRFLDTSHDPLDGVRRALARAPHIIAHLLDVTVEEDTVVLAGSVRTWYQKQVAQESVRHVEGVRRISNRIAVVPR